MIEVTLSDYTAEQSRIAASKREAEYRTARANYERAIAERASKRAALKAASQENWRARRYGAWLVSLLPRILHAMSKAPPAPRMAEATRDEIVWNAGAEGEQRVADVLRNLLDDEWVLVSGYKNRGGEIDKLLLGPSGALAIEIKFVNGCVSCYGDRWWRDKYDKYGNLVEVNLPITDRRGRSPSAQVNDATDQLQSFLRKRGITLRIARAVILCHPASSIGEIRAPTVDLIATLEELTAARLLTTVSGGLGGSDVRAVLALLKKDHQFHARARRGTALTAGGSPK